jgi:hypothetical protein
VIEIPLKITHSLATKSNQFPYNPINIPIQSGKSPSKSPSIIQTPTILPSGKLTVCKLQKITIMDKSIKFLWTIYTSSQTVKVIFTRGYLPKTSLPRSSILSISSSAMRHKPFRPVAATTAPKLAAVGRSD